MSAALDHGPGDRALASVAVAARVRIVAGGRFELAQEIEGVSAALRERGRGLKYGCQRDPLPDPFY
jgi:hypothetical protein